MKPASPLPKGLAASGVAAASATSAAATKMRLIIAAPPCCGPTGARLFLAATAGPPKALPDRDGGQMSGQRTRCDGHMSHVAGAGHFPLHPDPDLPLAGHPSPR